MKWKVKNYIIEVTEKKELFAFSKTKSFDSFFQVEFVYFSVVKPGMKSNGRAQR